MKKYLSVVLFLCGVTALPVFGTSLIEGDQQPKQRIQVKISNKVPGTDLVTLVNDKRLLVSDEQLKNIEKRPYILPNSADSTFNYIANIELMVTLTFKNGQSSSLIKPLSRNEEVLSYEFPFEDRKQLDRISAQVQGVSFLQLDLKDSPSKFIGDYRHVTLGSAWHPVQPGTSGWLHQDYLLCAYFSQGQSTDYPYKLNFGNEF